MHDYYLTNREKEVLRCIADGLSNYEIASKLVITSHTAKAHVASILKKTKSRSRIDLVIKVFKEGLVD